MDGMALVLPGLGPFRDEKGRFRRKTREDMGLFERVMHDANVRLAESMVSEWKSESSFLKNIPFAGASEAPLTFNRIK